MAASFGKLVGGRLCLDFVNTVQSRMRGPERGKRAGKGSPGRAASPERAKRVEGRSDLDEIAGERLTSYDDLLQWATLTSILTEREGRALARRAATESADAAKVLKRSLIVREAMYRLFKAAMEGRTPDQDDLATLNRELHIARAHQRLVSSPQFGWDWDRTAQALDRVLWPIVQSAAELLTSPEVARVGQCPGPECGWLFLDTSRGRRRQWCDMADCGNLAKVQRFRRRQRRLSSRG